MMFNYRFKAAVFFALAGLFFLNGCEQPFEPLEENDRYYFTVHGVLDASADTQWVRVMPVRDSIFTSPEPLDAEVTITRLSTGEKFALEDSLFEVRGGYYAWNFWTDVNIESGENYLFAAVNREGDSSKVLVQVPPEFSSPVVVYGEGSNTAQIFVEGIEKVAVLDIVYYYRAITNGSSTPVVEFNLSQTEDIRELPDGRKVVYAYPSLGEREINSQFGGQQTSVVHERQEILIVSGGPGWPETEGLSEPEKFLPGGLSNVENGLGVLVGAVSKRIPLQSCYDADDERIPCEPLDYQPPY